MMKKVILMIMLLMGVKAFCQQRFDNLISEREHFELFLQNADDSTQLLLIEYLLKMYGDEGVNLTWYGYTDSVEQHEYNAEKSTRSQVYPYVTNQLAALYLISSIYHSDLKHCDKIVIEYQGETKLKESTLNLEGRYYPNKRPRYRNGWCGKVKYKPVDTEVVDDLCDIYEAWFINVKDQGLDKVNAPLANSRYSWFKR